jgi:hypothetical protein
MRYDIGFNGSHKIKEESSYGQSIFWPLPRPEYEPGEQVSGLSVVGWLVGYELLTALCGLVDSEKQE